MITAKVIQDSRAPHGKRITTFELEYPRFIHSELMTHRWFSRNAASSRAIPVKAMIEMVRTSYARPIHWGKNQPGMQANEQLQEPQLIRVKSLWCEAAGAAADIAEKMMNEGAHKQIANRILEPFQHMKTVVTATDFDNFFHLRRHKDAQPEIHALADAMWEAREASTPMQLDNGEWHVPYVERARSSGGTLVYGNDMPVGDAQIISASCCAQVSYRKSDDSIEKARIVYDRLIGSAPVHASPVEHQATPGFKGSLSGNFMGWTQLRQMIPNHTCWNYEGEEC